LTSNFAPTNNSATYERDARVLTPADTSIIGFATGGTLTTTIDGTNISAYSQNNVVNTSISIDETGTQNIGTTFGQGQNDPRHAYVFTANNEIAMTQTADADGTNATPSFSTGMMSTVYGLPRAASDIRLAALVATTCTISPAVDSSTGSTTTFLTRHASASDPAPYTATGDETLMMGYTP
jgi:hypothetical protein